MGLGERIPRGGEEKKGELSILREKKTGGGDNRR